eukprot:3913563-Pyramimonas_sp.AAC.1
MKGGGCGEGPEVVTGEGYEVRYADFYEPYIVAARAHVPRYDERFRGYGMNKVSHLHAVAAAGLRFRAHPTAFVCAEEHAKSASWAAMFGCEDGKHTHRVRVAHLYQRFKCELRALEGASDPLPGAVRPAGPRPRDGAPPDSGTLARMAVVAAHVDFGSVEEARALARLRLQRLEAAGNPVEGGGRANKRKATHGEGQTREAPDAVAGGARQ